MMMNDVELTNEETEKILQFQELTGIDDINVARDILIRYNYNLELAFTEREKLNSGVPSLYASSQDSSRAPAVLNDRFLQHIFISNNRNNNNNVNNGGNSGIFGLLNYVVNSLFNWCYSTLSTFVQTLLSVFSERDRSE